MRAAYADPPYLGCAAGFYADLHPDAAAYDRLETHLELVARLNRDFDAWALSLHSPSLRAILPACPPDVRVLAWVKPWCSWKPAVRVAYTWEPVIVRGGRPRPRTRPTVRDYLEAPIAMNTGLRGAKPAAFCLWIFEVLGLEPGDDFSDLFPGSGAVSRAWDLFRQAARPEQYELTATAP